MDGTKLAGILADGTEWEDSDGRTAWPIGEVNALAELLESQGYHTSIFPAGIAEAADAAITAMADACGIQTQPVPDSTFYRPMRRGHVIRTGHEFNGYLASADGGQLWHIVRVCCGATELTELMAGAR